MRTIRAECADSESRRRTLRRLGLWTSVLLPPAFFLSVLLATSLTHQSHGTPTAYGVLRDLWRQSIEGDEEIFILLGIVLWTVSWAYGLASVIVPFGAGLERLWRPHQALANTLLALAVTKVFAVLLCVHARRSAAGRR